MFSGYKTHIVGILMILTGLANVVFPDSGLGGGDPMQMILTGLGLMGLRLGVANIGK